MLRLETNRGVRFCDGLTRRDFLQAGGLAVGLGLTGLARLQQLGAAPHSSEKACIQLFLVGGPGQLDTWDPKPDAPDNIRGPFRPIQTNVPGISICEHFPLMAKRADRFAILRSVNHQEAPIHETGHQLMQTGHLFQHGADWPHYGAVVSQVRSSLQSMPPWVVVPGPITHTGVNVSHGQGAGFLGPQHEPFVAGLQLTAANPNTPLGLDPARTPCRHALVDAIDDVERAVEESDFAPCADDVERRVVSQLFSPQAKKAFDVAAEPDAVRERYGWNTFGQSCLLARRLVQHGVRLVTVNMFDTVFNQITWDCHANGGDLNTTLDDYKQTLCPMLDRAYTALIDDLETLGLLDTTLVTAMGEFGRTPLMNARNGRDHWPGVWSILMAGAGIRGGQVIGASDEIGAEPTDRPIHPSEIAATVYHALDIDLATQLLQADGRFAPLLSARPVMELFR
jgi:uncharacterized protein (DUF1501 family)